MSLFMRYSLIKCPAAILLCFCFCSSELRAATYVVTSKNFGNTTNGISLRWAITQANANPGHDTIQFNISVIGVQTLNIQAAGLPNLTDAAGVTIDGFSQPGSSPNTNCMPDSNNAVILIQISRNGGTGNGLNLYSDNNIIQGLSIYGFGATGTAQENNINIIGSNNKILGCFIGMDALMVDHSTNRTDNGIWIDGTSSAANSNQIGDGTAAGANVIGFENINNLTATIGIRISGSNAQNNVIKGNTIGMDNANLRLGLVDGIYIELGASGAIIGGDDSGETNTISTCGVFPATIHKLSYFYTK